MDLARFIVDAVVLEHRSLREVAAAYGVSKSWVQVLVARHRAGGDEALRAASKAPHRSPTKVPDDIEDRIVVLRKELEEGGFDAGAHTIHHHLLKTGSSPPSVSSVWRVLKRRGFITPQPQKRPRSSFIRFEADLPNETWQSDVTFWELADGTKVEILNFIDDFSRVCVASKVLLVTRSPDVVAALYEAGGAWGLPASLLTDNGAVYTATYRHGYSAVESELFHLGISCKHSTPYHPQTCGKVERFHQTLKRFLEKRDPAHNIQELQAQIDTFVTYYNDERPHRARDRMTPRAAFDSRAKAKPRPASGKSFSRELRVRHDKVDNDGAVTLRYKSKLHHIGMGRALKGRRIVLLVAGRDIRVISEEGELLRHLTLDPSRDYQPRFKA